MHVHGTSRPHARRDRHPYPCGAVIPVVQEHPFAVKETAEAEVPVVFEKVAAYDSAMPQIIVVVVVFAIFLVIVVVIFAVLTVIVIFTIFYRIYRGRAHYICCTGSDCRDLRAGFVVLGWYG